MTRRTTSICIDCGIGVFNDARRCFPCYLRVRERPLAHRLIEKFTVGDGCWVWTGALAKGYGSLQRGQRGEGLVLAHRAVYELLVGPIPDGLEMDHLCPNKTCVRPDHLEPVTHAENMRRYGVRRKAAGS